MPFAILVWHEQRPMGRVIGRVPDPPPAMANGGGRPRLRLGLPGPSAKGGRGRNDLRKKRPSQEAAITIRQEFPETWLWNEENTE